MRLIRGNAGLDSLASARNKHGMALVLTLLIVAIITAMVVEFAYGVYTNTTSLYNWQTSQQLSLAARSAVKLAARVIAEKALDNTNTQATFDMAQKVPFGDLDTTVTLHIEDESAKFNINSLLPENFGQIDKDNYKDFEALLAQLKLPETIATRVADWIGPNSTSNSLGPEVGAKNARLDSVDELLLIPGIDRKTYERLLPYVTIYGSQQININDASLPVLMSLNGVVNGVINEQMAESIIEYRKTTPFSATNGIGNVAGFQTLTFPLSAYITTQSSIFHVTATAEYGGIKRTIDSVLQVTGINSATVLYWKET